MLNHKDSASNPPSKTNKQQPFRGIEPLEPRTLLSTTSFGLNSTEGFEGNTDNWYAESGVWQIGTPTVNPAGAYEGDNVATTVLDGNYDGNTDSRLISPEVTLPTLTDPDERLQLRYQQWYSYSDNDRGHVQIQTWNGATWDAWQTLATPANSSHYSPWANVHIDLTEFSGKHIQLAFKHTSSDPFTSTGWAIDNVELWQGTPTFDNPENFDNGLGDWHTDKGAWQYDSDNKRVTTFLSGNYHKNTDSRLISPEVVLATLADQNQQLQLRFNQTYSYSDNDQGHVQIQIWNGEIWDAWQTLATPANPSHYSPWANIHINLSEYAGQRVRLAFYHTSSDPFTSTGWTIDNVELWQGTPTFDNPENFDNGLGDWHTDKGAWQYDSDNKRVTTFLSGNYHKNTDSRLISPEVVLATLADQNQQLQLRFNQKYSYSDNDRGHVQIQVWNGTDWDDWQTLATPANSSHYSPWANIHINLSEYAGQRVRLAFYHTSSDPFTSTGWTIDNVELWQGTPTFDNPENFDNGLGDWHTDKGAWQYDSDNKRVTTFLSGNYHKNTDSRLISPEIILPTTTKPLDRIQLRFDHSFSYSDNDKGQIQIQVWNGTDWDDWQTLATPAPSSSSSPWTNTRVELAAYSGNRIRLAFYHTSSDPFTSTGWTIDNIQIWNNIQNATIKSRHIYYNNSKFDGNSTGIYNADNNAIANTKTPLLNGQTATSQNYTNYAKGINGIIIDIHNPASQITLDDFTFKIGNSNNTNTWLNAPTPSNLVVHPGQGKDGSHRVFITWQDGDIQNQWLQITTLSNANGGTLGLTNNDVFYYGNAVADHVQQPRPSKRRHTRHHTRHRKSTQLLRQSIQRRRTRFQPRRPSKRNRLRHRKRLQLNKNRIRSKPNHTTNPNQNTQKSNTTNNHPRITLPKTNTKNRTPRPNPNPHKTTKLTPTINPKTKNINTQKTKTHHNLNHKTKQPNTKNNHSNNTKKSAHPTTPPRG